jgi:hypothetical protein
MAETIKSVLFVDYDSIRRSLAKSDSAAAERIAARLPAWVNAIEAGRLASVPESGRRKILMRRCYADPAALADNRGDFTNQGFQVVDCPPLAGRDRSAADIQITLDTIDALGHPTAYDEFIILSADSDFSPLLLRLRAHDRQTVVYANPGTGVSYRAIADGTVEETSFAAFLTAADEVKEPAAASAGTGPATTANVASNEPAPDKVEIEALARKVHAATNVPLFSPRSYLEMFRVLAEEIRERGYHFQETAENVANKLTASGRNANRRQIVFVVKGLALKGHVFSNTDTPEHLAQVFREQVQYLIRNAGLELTPRENAVLAFWIIGRAGQTTPAEIDTATPVVAPPPAKVAVERPKPPEPQKPQTPVLPDLKPPRNFAKPLPSAKAEAPPPPPKPAPPPPAARQPEPPKPPQAQRVPLPPKPAPPKPAKPMVPPQGQRPGSGGMARPGANRNMPGGQTARPATPITPKPPAPKPTAEKQPEKAAGADKEAVESTILAAIAQAVDVLVEDRGQPKIATAAESLSDEETPSVAVEIEEATPEGDSGDIGDEIQRIIASYNRDRQGSEQQ